MKRVFLTGASSGIGRASAQLLIARGHEVWGTALDNHDSVQFTTGTLDCNMWQNPQNAVEKNGSVLAQIPPGRILYLSPGLTVYALPRPSAALDSPTRATALSKP